MMQPLSAALILVAAATAPFVSAQLRCGRGTHEVDGECVPTTTVQHDADGSALQMKVQGAMLTLQSHGCGATPICEGETVQVVDGQCVTAGPKCDGDGVKDVKGVCTCSEMVAGRKRMQDELDDMVALGILPTSIPATSQPFELVYSGLGFGSFYKPELFDLFKCVLVDTEDESKTLSVHGGAHRSVTDDLVPEPTTSTRLHFKFPGWTHGAGKFKATLYFDGGNSPVVIPFWGRQDRDVITVSGEAPPAKVTP